MNQTSVDTSPPRAELALRSARLPRRHSLRRQILLAALLPLLLMGAVLSIYTTFNVSGGVVTALRARGESIAGVTAEAVYEDLEKSSNPVFRADLNATAAFNLRAIRGAGFVAIADPNGIIVVAARSGLGSKPVQEALEGQDMADFVTVGAERFIVTERDVLKFDGTGSLGRVYIGLETTAISSQVWRALIPTLALLLAALGLAACLAIWLAARITRPILNATETANRISLGNLEGCAGEHANDEIGDLMQALERMRFSLKFMMERTKRK
jgi:methyl-accepting chemotaxis protein